jgi:hypothetical protein
MILWYYAVIGTLCLCMAREVFVISHQVVNTSWDSYLYIEMGCWTPTGLLVSQHSTVPRVSRVKTNASRARPRPFVVSRKIVSPHHMIAFFSNSVDVVECRVGREPHGAYPQKTS